MTQSIEQQAEERTIHQFMKEAFDKHESYKWPTLPEDVTEVANDWVIEGATEWNKQQILLLENDNQKMRGALEKIIEMNRRQAADQYGNPDRAESWSCVVVARAALGNPSAKSTD